MPRKYMKKRSKKSKKVTKKRCLPIIPFSSEYAYANFQYSDQIDLQAQGSSNLYTVSLESNHLNAMSLFYTNSDSTNYDIAASMFHRAVPVKHKLTLNASSLSGDPLIFGIISHSQPLPAGLTYNQLLQHKQFVKKAIDGNSGTGSFKRLTFNQNILKTLKKSVNDAEVSQNLTAGSSPQNKSYLSLFAYNPNPSAVSTQIINVQLKSSIWTKCINDRILQ